MGDDTATRAALLEAMSLDLYLTDRLQDAIAARERERAVDLRRDLGEVGFVGAGHTANSRDRRAAGHLPQDRPSRVRGPGRAGRPLAG